MIEEITDEQLNQLKSIAQQTKLKEELAKQISQVEELKVREEIEETDLSQDIQACEKRINEIKNFFPQGKMIDVCLDNMNVFQVFCILISGLNCIA